MELFYFLSQLFFPRDTGPLRLCEFDTSLLSNKDRYMATIENIYYYNYGLFDHLLRNILLLTPGFPFSCNTTRDRDAD